MTALHANDMIRVLLVDDHAMLRAGFRTILDSQPDITVVGEAATGAEAVAQASALRPDVISMDVQMPDMDGIEATRRIVADPEVHASIAIVTTFDRDDYLFSALDAGASGFLLKNSGPEDLVSAVRVLAAGDGMLAPEVTRRVVQRYAGASSGEDAVPTASAAIRPAEPFTDREAEVLALMAEAMSNAEIAASLFIGEATVKTHVSRILQKLGARDRVQAVVLALRGGLA
ncbi:response regulator transcription factor [Microbacterium sp.]|uniref:response regulator transcription factor n=1 Tax=Microbacterium sp. TaxID=51671 RepID=UPI002CC17A1C|nr:response regulator transcription factor [Microbacterium sp.]HWK76889.1 response regulator transcription factor [Microbacterium sp.]